MPRKDQGASSYLNAQVRNASATCYDVSQATCSRVASMSARQHAQSVLARLGVGIGDGIAIGDDWLSAICMIALEATPVRQCICGPRIPFRLSLLRSPQHIELSNARDWLLVPTTHFLHSCLGHTTDF